MGPQVTSKQRSSDGPDIKIVVDPTVRPLGKVNFVVLNGLSVLGSEQSAGETTGETSPMREIVVSVSRHGSAIRSEWVAAKHGGTKPGAARWAPETLLTGKNDTELGRVSMLCCAPASREMTAGGG